LKGKNMPYIKPELRSRFRPCLEEIPTNAGELNYAISMILKDYVSNQKRGYQVLNDVMGALTGAQLEFYRTVVVPFEEEKIKSNGEL
jgi:hypothetical protein